MDTLTERAVTRLLRSAAGAMLFAGVAIFIGAVPAYGFVTDPPLLQTVGAILLQIGGALLAAGIVAKILLRQRGRLPNERDIATDDQRPPIGGWLIVLVFTLTAAPVWLVIRLLPFLAEWKRVIDLLAAEGMWDSANANGSGLILMPLAGALTPPFIELVTMAAFIASSAVIVPLVLSRSPRLPRFYLVCTVLLSALAFASLRGASAAALAGDDLRQFVDATSVSAEEAATTTGTLDRYTAAVVTTGPPLVWTLFVYLFWLPPLLRSPRAERTFARRAEPPGPAVAAPMTVEAITTPPRFPGMRF
jgi:hypothetical protein